MTITVEAFEQLCRNLSEKRKEYENQKKHLSYVNSEVEALESMAVEYLNELDKDSYKSEYGTVSLNYRTSYRVPQGEERDKFFSYLKEKNIFEAMITVNSQTLNGWAKKEIEAAKEAGEQFPTIPGLGDPTITPGIRWVSKKE